MKAQRKVFFRKKRTYFFAAYAHERDYGMSPGDVGVYVEGWDEETEEPDGIFRRRKKFDNEGSWIAYVVGKK